MKMHNLTELLNEVSQRLKNTSILKKRPLCDYLGHLETQHPNHKPALQNWCSDVLQAEDVRKLKFSRISDGNSQELVACLRDTTKLRRNLLKLAEKNKDKGDMNSSLAALISDLIKELNEYE